MISDPDQFFLNNVCCTFRIGFANAVTIYEDLYVALVLLWESRNNTYKLCTLDFSIETNLLMPFRTTYICIAYPGTEQLVQNCTERYMLFSKLLVWLP